MRHTVDDNDIVLAYWCVNVNRSKSES